MKARNGGEVSAGPRHVQHDGSTEAITYGADPLGIDRGLLGELTPRGVKARLHHLRVLHYRSRKRAGVLRVIGGLGVAVHVSNEGCVALLRKLPRLVVDV